MASISLHGLRRVHPDGTVALSGVDLTVGDGELVGIIGPSGSGKSTLLRVVAGVEPITDGLVRIGGRDMTGVRPRDRNIALVSQSRNLYTFLDVAEQLALPLELRRTRSAEITRRVDAEGRAFGLGHIWHRRPRQLSAGDVQRTALARAMIRLPQALLADEPMQLLDPPTQTRVRAELHRLHIASAMTVLYTTNDHNQIMGIADRVAVLNDGRIVQTDPPQQLLSRPRNRFVAGFVGEPAMTFMAATVVADAGLGWLQVGSQRLRVPGGLPGPLR
ncbi:MAG: ABC transporter ATP-binding protein, partial [Euzebya sp.]